MKEIKKLQQLNKYLKSHVKHRIQTKTLDFKIEFAVATVVVSNLIFKEIKIAQE